MNGYEKQTGLEPLFRRGFEVVGDKMQICAPYLLVIPLEGKESCFSSVSTRVGSFGELNVVLEACSRQKWDKLIDIKRFARVSK